MNDKRASMALVGMPGKGRSHHAAGQSFDSSKQCCYECSVKRALLHNAAILESRQDQGPISPSNDFGRGSPRGAQDTSSTRLEQSLTCFSLWSRVTPRYFTLVDLDSDSPRRRRRGKIYLILQVKTMASLLEGLKVRPLASTH